MLLNITGGPSLGLFEVNEAAEIIAQVVDPEANIIFGAVIDEQMAEEVRVTVIATGFDGQGQVSQSDLQVKKPALEEELYIPEFLRRSKK